MTEEHLESLLPDHIKAMATVRGHEYAWPLDAVDDVIVAARELGLACLGGQVQFRFPDGTCELYWLNADCADRAEGETWAGFVERSGSEVAQSLRNLRESKDFVQEGAEGIGFVRDQIAAGVDVSQYLCFVMYFEQDE